jgi:transposase
LASKSFYLPKYHCEISTIEGVWRHEKSFSRKFNDQKFSLFFVNWKLNYLLN